ncbi:hypothetical protein Goklo_003339 [Gossypium klotzschianum]|uniref:Uncharacterized protein n=1 Tax=Gossypium klotzschianum TaxID=34286 RepID=A0A7J8VVZ8_9ROSI|nr:hypothetical protein [Gossypium klotzschianum]
MATAATRSNPHPHILVFPYPAQGHMLALLDLTHQLALHGLTITILVTPKNLPFLSPLLSSHPSSITPLVFPFPSHPLIPPGVEHVKDVGNCGNRLIMAALGKLEDPLFNWFNSQSNPPVAIISDFFLGWTQHLATRLQIPRLAFFSTRAFLVSVFDYIWNNVEKVKCLSEVEFGHLPGSPVFKQEHLPSLFKLYKISDPDWEFVKDGLLANTKSWGYVLNSFDALEGEYVQWLKTHVMTWLNQCPDGSAVYVCFGSQKLLRKEQMEALANGLEKSDTRFIWVVKPGTTQQHVEGFGVVPDGFEQRTAGQAIVGGVMMLAWPMEADQFVNARLLVDDMGVGVRVCEGADSVPNSDELGRVISEAMTEGGGMKTKAKDLKEKAFAAVSHGGSSMNDLVRFVKELGKLGR